MSAGGALEGVSSKTQRNKETPAILRDGKPVETELDLRAKRRGFVSGDLAETSPTAPAVNTVIRYVRLTEEPDVGNPQVRFREGH